MIININHGVFGGALRNGDLVGVCNIIEYIRKLESNKKLKFFMENNSISPSDYSQKFFNFLLSNTDYFSASRGDHTLNWNKVNLWDFRSISGDLVKIPNNLEIKKKIVIFPLFDAPYNTYRNWPINVFNEIINQYSTYTEYEKIICISDINLLPYTPEGYKISIDFMDNIYHIMDAEIFIGGDTGTSHFAGCLNRGPKELIYYYSNRGLLHTTPFYWLHGRGKLNTYWLDCEGSTF
jgi:hypothetical protein